jgi:hypothetical protein
MMNLYVQDLLNDFEYEVKQGHYKKMDYGTWRSLNDKRSSLATIEITRDLYSDAEFPDDEITLIVDGLSYVFDGWDRSFGEFLNEFMAMELKMDSSVFDALSAVTTSASKSTSELLNSIQDNYSSVYYNRDDWSTATSISSNFYEKQPTIEITEQGLKLKGQYVEEIIDEVTGNSIQIRKEKDNMDLIKNFDFGSCANDNVKVSMYGIAVKNANGTWVSYNPKTGDVMDVDILNFDGKYLYKMPVALKDVKSGDVVIHNRKPMFVSKVEGGKILAIDPAAGEEKVIMLTKNMFGFDFATKVINLFEGFTGGASADAPFGNMFPLMMLADNKNNDMLPFMLMMNGGKMDSFNPMMMYFLMKDNKGDNDMLPFLLMSNFSGNCNCHCDCDCDREG